MILIHWILEYAAVLCGYVFLLFIWPSVVFRKHLAKKSKVYWFCFCVAGQMVLINTVVLVFGLLHILNKWTILAFFYGIFLLVILRKVKFNMGTIEDIRHLVMGVYGKKRIFFRIIYFLQGKLKQLCAKIWAIIYPHLGEYAVLALLLIFGMIYFSYGAFQDYSYGYSDMNVHHSWIYGLVEGRIFSAGVYPEGMHCFVYCMHILFGISIYSNMLFIGGIHIAVTLLAIYVLLREVFAWSYTPFFVIAMFLTLDMAVSMVAATSMSRLQCMLPQEFGMYTEFLCALYLIRYLKYSRQIVRKGSLTRFYWDENLFLLIMSIAASISIHFYATIMAVLICIAVALCSIWKVFSRKRFVPLVAAVLCGVLIAALPMAGALASGIPFQGSIGWAMGVINGTEDDEAQVQETKKDKLTENQKKEKITVKSLAQNGMTWAKATGAKLYSGCQRLYGAERARWVVILTCFSAVLWLAFRLLAALIQRRCIRKKSIAAGCFNQFPGMILALVVFVVAYTAPQLGLPELVQIARLGATANILCLSVIIMPIDMLFTLVSWFGGKRLLQIISVCCMIGIYIGTNYLGIYHGYLNYELTRYNAAVTVTESIIRTLPRYTYTIVSPTEELYPVIDYGRHEELLTFVEKSDKEVEYTLPTQYVFLYIEKQALNYAQYHFFSGPSWLAIERERTDYPASRISYCPEVCGVKISKEAAQEELKYTKAWSAYTHVDMRTVLESKAYEWCQRFSKTYPLELNVYYEDENFICYYFAQEPHAPYNLAIK
ncbi:hypothetical protein D3Z38_15690 [Clostridiales bacterium]|nr:hypothetical protein [Clostridiales bacterium]